MINSILNFLDRQGLHSILTIIIFVGHLSKGRRIKSVSYNKELRVWISNVSGDYFVSRGPGWAYDIEYLTEVFRQYSGYGYRPGLGEVVVDVGAGLGEETFLFSKWVGEMGKVFSIEAAPSTFRVLQYAVKLNKLENVSAHQLAVSDSVGMKYLEIDEDHFLQSTLTEQPDLAAKHTVEINGVTLDHFFEANSISRVDFLRVNIEGAEQLMIKGMRSSIGMIRHISISCHDFRQGSEFYKTSELVLRFLVENDFRVTQQHSGDAVRDNYLYGINNRLCPKGG